MRDAPMQKEHAELAAALAARKEQLAREVRDKMAEARALSADTAPGEVVDGGDVSQHAVLAEVDRAEADRDLAELAAIEAAERRLADGTYGSCLECGVAIPAARLRASPAAARCIACQSARERSQP